MEDLPRESHDKDDDTESKSESRRRKEAQAAGSFLNRWLEREGISSHPSTPPRAEMEKNLKNKLEKSDDDDDEEDDDNPTSKSRKNTQESDSQESLEERQDSEISKGEDQGGTAVSVEEILGSVEDSLENDTTEDHEIQNPNNNLAENSSTANSEDHQQNELLPSVSSGVNEPTQLSESNHSAFINEHNNQNEPESINSSDQTIEDQPELVVDHEDLANVAPISTEPESVQQIIERQSYGNSNFDQGGGPSNLAEAPISAASSSETIIERSRSNTGALLAVDFLSHRANRRHINKNQKSTQNEFAKIRQEQIDDKYNLEQQIYKSQLQQKEREHLIALGITGENSENSQKIENYIYNRPSNESIVSVNNNEQQNIIDNTKIDLQINKSLNENEKAETKSSFEHTLERMAQANQGEIKSEFQYERRHEVMDTPGEDRKSEVVNVLHDFDPEVVKTQNQMISAQNHATTIPSVDSSDEQSSQAVYKQAAITGFWGALAGIILFTIIYLLRS